MSLTWIFMLMFAVTAFPAVGLLHKEQQQMRADPHADLSHYNKIMPPLILVPSGFMLVALTAGSPRWLAVAGMLMGLAMVGTGAVLFYRNHEYWNRIQGRDSSSPYYTNFVVPLPWPMTIAASMLYLLSWLLLLFGGWALVVWGSIAALPSLWWLLPALAWPFLCTYVLWRPLVRLFEPQDAVQRWIAVIESSEGPGSSRP